jgi:hypothetical protein
MPTTKQLTFDTVNFDDSAEADEFEGQLFAAGLARVKAESDELRRRGLLDADGNLLPKELPADMNGGTDRDFGG